MLSHVTGLRWREYDFYVAVVDKFLHVIHLNVLYHGLADNRSCSVISNHQIELLRKSLPIWPIRKKERKKSNSRSVNEELLKRKTQEKCFSLRKTVELGASEVS